MSKPDTANDIVVMPAENTALSKGVKAKFKEVREHLGEFKKHAQATSWHAYAAGRLLLDLKAEMRTSDGDEGFQDAIKRELPGYSYGTARNYMDFARKMGQANPEIKQLGEDKAPEAIAQIAAGRTLTQLYMDLGVVKRPANQSEDGKRIHHPTTKSPSDRHEDAAVKRAKNMADAIDALQIEVDHGNFDSFTDEEAEIRLKQLEGICAKIRDEVIAPRAAAKKRAGNSRRPARDL